MNIQMRTRVAIGTITCLVILLLPLAAAAQGAATFSDVPSDSPVLPAVQYLAEKGMIQTGVPFRPNDKITRAQVAKILVAPLVAADQLKLITSSTFTDVPAGQWYVPYVEAAKVLGIVNAAPTFNPNGNVTKAAFLKKLFTSKKLNFTTAFSDLNKPLAADAQNVGDWTYPIMRFALASSVTAVNQDGTLGTAQEITRGQMAILYYRLDMYLEGRRTQALLSQAEIDIGNVLQLLNAQDMSQAEWAAARSVLATRGALTSRPNEPMVKGAVKVSEGFRSLVAGYKAGSAGNYDAAIASAKEAYALSVKANEFAPGLSPIATQMQSIAKNMADNARQLKAQAAK
jgi:hypothetical protein